MQGDVYVPIAMPQGCNHPETEFGVLQTQQMTVLQVFRAVLTLIAAPGVPKFTLKCAADADAAPSVAEHAASSPCVALDSSHYLNVLAGVPACAWRAVQAAAACTLSALSGALGLSGATMGPLFHPTRCATITFDAVAHLEVPVVATGDLFRADAPWSACIAKRAEGLLRKALSDRVVEVAVLQEAVSAVPACGTGALPSLPGVSSAAGLLVGAILNPLEVRAALRYPGHVVAALHGMQRKLACVYRTASGQCSDCFALSLTIATVEQCKKHPLKALSLKLHSIRNHSIGTTAP